MKQKNSCKKLKELKKFYLELQNHILMPKIRKRKQQERRLLMFKRRKKRKSKMVLMELRIMKKIQVIS